VKILDLLQLKKAQVIQAIYNFSNKQEVTS
jgi:hypothetical protein